MKNLELEQFGVLEMNAKEMKETDGGCIEILVALALFSVGVLIGDWLAGQNTNN